MQEKIRLLPSADIAGQLLETLKKIREVAKDSGNLCRDAGRPSGHRYGDPACAAPRSKGRNISDSEKARGRRSSLLPLKQQREGLLEMAPGRHHQPNGGAIHSLSQEGQQ